MTTSIGSEAAFEADNDDTDLTDLLSTQEEDHEKPPSLISGYYNPDSRFTTSGLCNKIFDICWYFLLMFPTLSKILIFSSMFLSLYVVINAIGNRGEIGVVKHDFTNVKSRYDLDLGQIDHWCIDVSPSSLQC